MDEEEDGTEQSRRHLEAALETEDIADAHFHIRQALQLLIFQE